MRRAKQERPPLMVLSVPPCSISYHPFNKPARETSPHVPACCSSPRVSLFTGAQQADGLTNQP